MIRLMTKARRIAFSALCLFVAAVAMGGTLVFPPSSPPSHTRCEFENVQNGCATTKFLGGKFTTTDGVSKYVGGYLFPECTSTTISWQFPPYGATSVNATVFNEGLIDGQILRVDVTDQVDGTPVTTTQEYGFPKEQAVAINAAGEGISNITVTLLNEFHGPVQPTQAAWSVRSMVVIQPVWPTIDLKVGRGSGGTYNAIIDYVMPAESATSLRALTLQSLPAGEEPGQSFPINDPIGMAGRIVVPIGTFNTDHVIRATAFACDTSRTAEATTDCTNCKGPATSVGGPVRLFDGVMTYSESDPLPSTFGSEFRREYSSGGTANRRFGLGWTSIFDAESKEVDIDADTKSVALTLEDRRSFVFRQLATGAWKQISPAGGLAATLTGSESSGYTLRDAGSSIVRTFNLGRLTAIHDLRADRGVVITYDSSGNPTNLADESGNWSATVTTVNGHVTTIAVDGRPDLTWTYGYAGSLLTSVTVAGASTPWRTYEYASNRLAVIRDAAGSAIESHDYDATGRATSSYDVSGDITSIQYPAGDANGIATTTVTRADNSVATFEQVFAGGSVVTRKADGGCSSCGANDATAAYDAKGNLTRLQNGRGYVTLTSYALDGRHVASTTTAMRPSGCDPETDPAHCRLTSDALAAAVLVSTTASQTTSYQYTDPNWPDRPTRITRNSVIQPNGTASETFSFDAVTSETLVQTATGAIDAAGTQEAHTTTTLLYGTNDPAAFAPGGAFQSAWLSLPQPAKRRKSIDGPRTDVSDVTTFVYYPNDAVVPGSWRTRLAAVKNAAGHITRFEDYDVFGHAAKIIDPNGVITRITFDALGRTATTTVSGIVGCDTSADPICASDLTSAQTYAGTGGLLVSERAPAGNVRSYTYDARGRLETSSRGTASTALERMTYTYDPTSGKKTSEVLSAFENGAWATKKNETFSYTSTGELAAVIHSDATRTSYTYLPDGAVESAQDENHTTPNTRYAYDPANRLSSVTQTLAGAPGGQIVTRYSYDLQGNLISVTDPNGNVTTYVYDDFGRMQRQTSPVSGTTTYSYDLGGNLLTTTHANGATTSRVYDVLGRVTSSTATRGSSTETVTWTYDDPSAGAFSIGRLASLTDPTGSTTYRYERRGLLRAEVKTIAGSSYTTTYEYDANGNRSALVYPTGLAARYGFDFADRPLSLTAGATTIVSAASYLPFGPLTSLTFGNGTTRTMQYDPRYRPLENKLTGPSGTIAQYAYAEDNAGNITQIHDVLDARYNRDFGYDDLNRLTTANSGSLLWGAGSYSYDAMGNMLSSSLGSWKSTSLTLVGTTPKLNAVVENGVSRPVNYDAAGNETFVGSSAFAYSPRNQLVSADAASYAYDGRGLLTISTVSVLAVSAAPSSVIGGGVMTGTVTLSAPAPAATTVTLTSSNPAAANVPATVTVTSGATTASFTISTVPVAATAPVTIGAAFNQYSASTSVLVLPAQLSSLAIAPSSVLGGNSATGTVTLTGNAAGNLTVALSSNDSAVTVPPTVTVAAGSSTATFSLTTTAGVANRTATITATLAGISRTATLTLTPPEIASLSISPSSLLNGGTATGTITLNAAAASNIVVSLSTSAIHAYPAVSTVSIPTGATSGTFTIFTNLQSLTPKTATITATQGSVTKQATVTVIPPWLTSLALSPSAPVGGEPSTATATINGSAPANTGYQVTFSSSNTSLVATPKPITYAGSTTGQTTVLSNPVTAPTPVVVTGTDSTGVSVSQTLTLQPAPVTLSTFTLSASSVVGSNSVTGTVTLTAVAPAGGIEVDLKTTNNPMAVPPTYVRIPAGAQSATFTVKTNGTFTTTNVTLSAIHAATTKTATLSVQAPSQANWVGAITFTSGADPYQGVVVGGTSIGATANLSNNNATKNTAVTLTSSNPTVASVPSSVTVNKGSGSKAFTVTTSSVAAPVDITITASAGGTIFSVKLIVLPAGGVSVAYVASTPGGGPAGTWYSAATVTLTGPAPSGGVIVTVGGSRRNIVDVAGDTSGSTTVTIPAGSTVGTIVARPLPFTGINRATTVTATYANITRSADLTITSQPQASLAPRQQPLLCASMAIGPCLSTVAGLTPTPLAAGDASGYVLYTPEFNLLAETEISTAPSKPIAYSYLWFGDLPVAQVESATNVTRWYATDHLGTPLIQTNSSGIVAWYAEHAPYGGVVTFRAGYTSHQPLRLPGQLAQDSNESYYNVFRWYRSGWGRYTQADPLAPAVGVSHQYAYVDGSPLGFVDPLGLVKIKHTFTKRFFNAELGGEQGLPFGRASAAGKCIGCDGNWHVELSLVFDHGYSCAFPYQCKQEMTHANIESAFVSKAAEAFSKNEREKFAKRADCEAAATYYARDLERYVLAPHLWDKKLLRDYNRAQSDYEATHHGWCAPGWLCAD